MCVVSLNSKKYILAELATEKLIWGQILGKSGAKWKGFTYCILHVFIPYAYASWSQTQPR